MTHTFITRENVSEQDGYAWNGKYFFKEGQFWYEGCGCGSGQPRRVSITEVPREGWRTK